MHFKLIAVVSILEWLLQTAAASSFRILAPPFVCPKDKEDVIERSDSTIITLQTDAGVDMNFTWSVRWSPLATPTQRFTLALWRVVRKLERDLNKPQTEPGVYLIDNTELLSGVNYIFNVTALFPENDGVEEKSFNIDIIQGDQKLLIEGQSNMFSIELIGGQMTYADLDYVLEAQVTTCYKTQDYYFSWLVTSGDTSVNVSYARGSILEIKAHSLTPGLSYNVLCKVFKFSDSKLTTENGLQFHVLHRDLNVNFNIDVLTITVDTPFDIFSDIKKIVYFRNELEITWECTQSGEQFEDFNINDDDGVLTFPSGLPILGEYLVSVTLTVLGTAMTSHSAARIIAVEHHLPIIEVYFTPRLVNEDSLISLIANISDVAPGCSATWYFSYDECDSPTNITSTELCTDNENGVPISDTLNFYSLEENFLSKLTDYSNETSWKSITAQLQAATGTARIVAKCQCNKIDNCSTEGTVYADVNLTVNEKPGAGQILVMPETGTAMETVFRISTLAIVDPNRPLRYTFFCELGSNESLVLGTYVEHLAMETLLPYKDGGTSIWVEVCDSLGACSVGAPTSIDLAPGEARTLDALIANMQALIMRCEIGLLRRLVLSTVVTYMNTDQTKANEKFTTALLATLQGIDQNCTEGHYDQYGSFLYWLTTAGIDTSGLI